MRRLVSGHVVHRPPGAHGAGVPGPLPGAMVVRPSPVVGARVCSLLAGAGCQAAGMLGLVAHSV